MRVRCLLLLLLGLAPFHGLARAAATEEALSALAGLGWMAGCWSGQESGLTMEECWTAPGGGILLGMHRDVSSKGKSFFEFLRIAAAGDSVTYWGSPMGKPPTPFRMTEQAPNRAVFENRAHDFPQRILYWLEGDQTLHARVEGTEKGVARHEEWQWRRAGGGPARAAEEPTR